MRTALALLPLLLAPFAAAQDQAYFDTAGTLVQCGSGPHLQPDDGGSWIALPDTQGFPLGASVYLVGIGGGSVDPTCPGHGADVTHFVLSAAPVFDLLCGCDTAPPCPAAASASPDHGCVNHAGLEGRLTYWGLPTVTPPPIWPLELRGDNLVPGQALVPFMGTSAPPVPFGNGLLCVGGATWRLPLRAVESWGAVSIDPFGETASLPPAAQLVPGSTWSFQLWYRDGGGACRSSFNTTNAVQVTVFP